MWTYQRYRTWLETRKTWHRATDGAEDEPAGELGAVDEVRVAPPLPPPVASSPAKAVSSKAPAGGPAQTREDLLEIQPEEGGLEAIISKLKSKP
jgi:hypothetical protein